MFNTEIDTYIFSLYTQQLIRHRFFGTQKLNHNVLTFKNSATS